MTRTPSINHGNSIKQYDKSMNFSWEETTTASSLRAPRQFACILTHAFALEPRRYSEYHGHELAPRGREGLGLPAAGHGRHPKHVPERPGALTGTISVRRYRIMLILAVDLLAVRITLYLFPPVLHSVKKCIVHPIYTVVSKSLPALRAFLGGATCRLNAK